MKRYLLELSFCGRNYKGSQRQKDVPSVQKTVEDALSKIYSSPILLRMASRLDAGVSARQFFCTFDAEENLLPAKLVYVLNNALADTEIAVRSAKIVPDAFDCRRDAYMKEYSYTVNLGEKEPLKDFLAWKPQYQKADGEKMAEAMALFSGKHDFSAFVKTDDKDFFPYQEIEKIEAIRDGNYLTFHIYGHAFGRHQIRMMVGAAYLYSIGQIGLDAITSRLEGKNKEVFPYAAPGKGLVLEKISYDKGTKVYKC